MCLYPTKYDVEKYSELTAQELHENLFEKIGYVDDNVYPEEMKFRFNTATNFLNELIQDPELEEYDYLFISDVQERTLEYDIILGHLKKILEKNKDIKIILTSAGEDKNLQTFLGVEGLGLKMDFFPPSIFYKSPLPGKTTSDALIALILEKIDKIKKKEDNFFLNDIIIFTSGIDEIKYLKG